MNTNNKYTRYGIYYSVNQPTYDADADSQHIYFADGMNCLFDSGAPAEYNVVENAKITREKNSTGSLSFTLHPKQGAVGGLWGNTYNTKGEIQLSEYNLLLANESAALGDIFILVAWLQNWLLWQEANVTWAEANYTWAEAIMPAGVNRFSEIEFFGRVNTVTSNMDSDGLLSADIVCVESADLLHDTAGYWYDTGKWSSTYSLASLPYGNIKTLTIINGATETNVKVRPPGNAPWVKPLFIYSSKIEKYYKKKQAKVLDDAYNPTLYDYMTAIAKADNLKWVQTYTGVTGSKYIDANLKITPIEISLFREGYYYDNSTIYLSNKTGAGNVESFSISQEMGDRATMVAPYFGKFSLESAPSGYRAVTQEWLIYYYSDKYLTAFDEVVAANSKFSGIDYYEITNSSNVPVGFGDLQAFEDYPFYQVKNYGNELGISEGNAWDINEDTGKTYTQTAAENKTKADWKEFWEDALEDYLKNKLPTYSIDVKAYNLAYANNTNTQRPALYKKVSFTDARENALVYSGNPIETEITGYTLDLNNPYVYDLNLDTLQDRLTTQ